MSSLFHILFRRLRSPLIVLVAVYSISILGFVLIPGVDDQGAPWDMSFFHAFYFVSFMATTIGFGEIPYAFTDTQRFWALITMYATVVAWLYCIGMLLSIFQDAVFRQQLRINSFRRRVGNIREPFYIVCGYGDTGTQLTRSLTNEHILCVVIDIDENRITELEGDDFKSPVFALCADASQSEYLEMAGVTHRWCQGMVTLANDDTVNLTVAIVAQLLNPDLRLIARAETPEAEANILSFGANEVINPFETFASRLALAIRSPSLYCLYDWMTGITHQVMKEPPDLEPGLWIISGFGRFGNSLYEHLDDEDVELRVIESDRSIRDLPAGTVIGRATEAATLRKAGIKEAVGIIAGTNVDANNLSILMTAFEENPDLFRVARQNEDKNAHLFEAAHLNMVMQRGSVISNTIFALIKTPLLGDFLRIVSRFKNDRANELVSSIIGVVENDIPELWELSINAEQTPALHKVLQNQQLLVSDILYGIKTVEEGSTNYQKKSLPLFLRRGDGNVILPEGNRFIKEGDRYLMCGSTAARDCMIHSLKNINLLEYILTGEDKPTGWVLRKLWERRHNKYNSKINVVDDLMIEESQSDNELDNENTDKNIADKADNQLLDEKKLSENQKKKQPEDLPVKDINKED
ncbi:TrkA family potassium uptake protein [uncultured Cocleimonas sp.]|uniref:potassium channel family protein n=1 Tax=uncultured Cocleimonas sp. TaxID=1051587 RepID=UPI00261E6BDD|nr:NAD-binding protein [uncultured Cocleimonas sp.]